MSAAFIASALAQFVLGLVVAWLIGPAEFGAYALALAAAVLIQTGAFEWVRLSTTRFHHAGVPRAFYRRLRRAMVLGMLVMTIFAGMALILKPAGRPFLFALAPLIAAAAGFADFRAAALRAEFEQGRYAAFLLARNLAGALLLPLAAWHFEVAEAVLTAFLASLLLAIAVMALTGPRRARPSGTPLPVPGTEALIAYSAPVVATNLLYLGLFLGLRTLLALIGGIGLAGQVSLALDFVLKLFTTAGTAMDLLLFQLAVRDEREHGAEAGRARLRANAGLVLAVMLPMAVGLALAAGPLEPLLVSDEYRGIFSAFVVALLPGVGLYALAQYALHPGFQLRRQTVPLIVAGALALVVALPIVALAPRFGVGVVGATGGGLGAGMLAACLWLSLRLGGQVLPEPGTILRILAATALMAGAVTLTRMAMAGPLLAPAIVAVGVVVYALAAYALDIAGVRSRRGRIS